MPVAVFSVGCAFGTDKFSWRTMSNMILVTIGVAIASYGEGLLWFVGRLALSTTCLRAPCCGERGGWSLLQSFAPYHALAASPLEPCTAVPAFLPQASSTSTLWGWPTSSPPSCRSPSAW